MPMIIEHKGSSLMTIITSVYLIRKLTGTPIKMSFSVEAIAGNTFLLIAT